LRKEAAGGALLDVELDFGGGFEGGCDFGKPGFGVTDAEGSGGVEGMGEGAFMDFRDDVEEVEGGVGVMFTNLV